jgi:hypothetical protein
LQYLKLIVDSYRATNLDDFEEGSVLSQEISIPGDDLIYADDEDGWEAHAERTETSTESEDEHQVERSSSDGDVQVVTDAPGYAANERMTRVDSGGPQAEGAEMDLEVRSEERFRESFGTSRRSRVEWDEAKEQDGSSRRMSTSSGQEGKPSNKGAGLRVSERDYPPEERKAQIWKDDRGGFEGEVREL